LGFDVCPEYPRPYAFNEWPTSYRVEGSFPAGFAWGLGTAAYQIEGGYRDGGRGASIWDTFTGANTVGMPGGDCSYCCKVAPCPVSEHMIAKGATGNVACDHYHTWRSDIALMKSMGLKHYRFSISWPRMVPTGKVRDGAGVNQEAVKFYNALIDELLAAGITPYVTLYHWDLPQALLSPPEVQGWWSSDPDTGEPNGQILQDWLNYADACFAAFGDRVKVWMTFNEAWTFTWLGSGWGKAPSITPFNDMNYHPWIAAHNVLNAHAEAVALYRRKYQAKQGGKIGITNNCDWREPASQSPYDVAAAERAVLWSLAWFTDPIFGKHGDYPKEMRRLLGAKLPAFTKEQKRLLNGSADFFGLNHYGSGWASTAPEAPGFDGARVKISEKGFPNAQSNWLFSVPWGFRKLLNWVDKRYNRPPIYVTENGWSLNAKTSDEGKADRQRLEFYANYTSEMRKAIVEDGVDVRGYFAWSLLDNFEWDKGYVERFGTTYVDFAYGDEKNSPKGPASKPTEGFQTRTRKDSSCWLEAVWRRNALVSPAPGNFPGCAPSSALTGLYIDVERPSCWREIKVDASGRTGKIWGIDGNASSHCDGVTDVSWVLPANFSGGTVIVDLSVSDGPAHLLGYWDSVKHSVQWGDGKTWSKQAVPVSNVSSLSINMFEELSASNKTAGSKAGNQELIHLRKLKD